MKSINFMIIFFLGFIQIFSFELNNQVMAVYDLNTAEEIEAHDNIIGISLDFEYLLKNDRLYLPNNLNIFIFLNINDINNDFEILEKAQLNLIPLSSQKNIKGMYIKLNETDIKYASYIIKTFSSIIKEPDIERGFGIYFKDINKTLLDSLKENDTYYFFDFIGLKRKDKSAIKYLEDIFPDKKYFYIDKCSLLNEIILNHADMLYSGFNSGFVFSNKVLNIDDDIFHSEMYPEPNDYELIYHNKKPVPFYSFFEAESLTQTLMFNAGFTKDRIIYDGLYIESMDIDEPEMYIVCEEEIKKRTLSFRLYRTDASTRFLNLEKGSNLIILKYIPYSLKTAEIIKEQIDIADEKTLTASDILARFYPKKIVSDTMLENYIARGTTHYYFSTPAFDDRVEIKTNDIYFQEKNKPIEWMEESLYLNGAGWSREGFPEIPFIGSGNLDLQPSNIHFDDVYEYKLIGETIVNERECYILSFTPKENTDKLPTGSLYIDKINYHIIRLEYRQKGINPPIISNHQIEDYTYIMKDGISYIIPERIRSHEVLNMAGRNIFIDKSRLYNELYINDPDFHKKKQKAYEGPSTIMQLTQEGPKLLKRDKEGNRVLQEEIQKNFLFLVGGLVGDLSAKYPLLPLAGINYFDYDFLNKNYHLNIFTAIAINSLTFSTGKPVLNDFFSSLSFDIFVPIVSFSDQIYYHGKEIEDHSLDIYTLNANMGLTKRLTSHLNLYLLTQIRYLDYKRSDDTHPDFIVPDSGFLINQSSELQLSYYGFSASANFKFFYRTQNSNFGISDYEHDNLFYGTMNRSFYTYGANIKRNFDIFKIDSTISISYRKLNDYDRFNLLDLGSGMSGIHGFSPGKIKTDESFDLNFITGLNIADILKWKLYFDASYLNDLYSHERKLYYGAGFSFSFMLFKSFVCNIDYGYGFNQPRDNGKKGNHRFTFAFIRFLR